jgi:hypothetical protein
MGRIAAALDSLGAHRAVELRVLNARAFDGRLA